MNAGACLAKGEVLVFLHADSTLPPRAFENLRILLQTETLEAGTFRLKFDQKGFWPLVYSVCSRLQWHRICFGDRGLFVRRSIFESLGGFSDIPIFEDLQLVQQLYRRGRFHYLNLPVKTAFRRFDECGHVNQQWVNLKLWLRYQMGTPPEKLAALYPPQPNL